MNISPHLICALILLLLGCSKEEERYKGELKDVPYVECMDLSQIENFSADRDPERPPFHSFCSTWGTGDDVQKRMDHQCYLCNEELADRFKTKFCQKWPGSEFKLKHFHCSEEDEQPITGDCELVREFSEQTCETKYSPNWFIYKTKKLFK